MTPEQQAAYSQAQQLIEECRRSGAKKLALDGLDLSELPPEIGQLSGLEQLSIGQNLLTALPAELARLPKLGFLYAPNNLFREIPPVVFELAQLQSLTLRSNRLSVVAAAISRLRGLHTLDFGLNEQLTALPDELGTLPALASLWAMYCKIDRLPPALCRLKSLQGMFLGGNPLTSLPGEIGRLSTLTQLSLPNCGLQTLPPEVGRLAMLEILVLHGNKLRSLPTQLLQLKGLRQLFLHGNPALDIPGPLLGATLGDTVSDKPVPAARPADILDFYFAQRQGAAAGTLRAIGEIKLMLVGRGEAGKTSLRRFFMGQPHNRTEQETSGITLDSFRLVTARGDVRVRLWDFAGQEITHALHQFFLTEGCVYVLVLDPRSNTEMRDAEYWLGLLQRYAKGTPVLVALNRQDARQGGYDVDRRQLQERFNTIRAFVPTNCETREGCDTLLLRLRETIAGLGNTELPHLQVPQSWLAVMADCDPSPPAQASAPGSPTESGPQPGIAQRLLHRLGLRPGAAEPVPAPPPPEAAAPPRQRLSLEQFRAICSQHGVVLADQQESLARLLHRLGAVLHFIDEPRLRDTAVLSPHWVTDGVYRLLRFKDKPDSDGTLTLAEAMQALPGESEDTVRFFLRLMERFEMCLPLDQTSAGQEVPLAQAAQQWLIPGALGAFQPEALAKDWQASGSVRLRYLYDPLPEGVLPRFIVLTHPLSQGQPRWRHGVVLRQGAAAALVRRGDKPNQVDITAFGPDAERLELLQIVQGSFERIHVDLPEPRPVAELALEGLDAADIFRPVADLEAAEARALQVAVNTPLGPVDVAPTPQLNLASEPASRDAQRLPLQTFLSYSHLDKRAKNTFALNLTVMAKKRLTSAWHDGLIEPGMLWLDEITQSLQRMDLFVGLLTTAFVASDFIERVELKAARERLAREDRDFLFVLVLVDDISLHGLDLADYQVLRPGGKAISRHASLKAGFDQAQRELERLVQARQQQLLARPNPAGPAPAAPRPRHATLATAPAMGVGMAPGPVLPAPLAQPGADALAVIAQQAPGPLKHALAAVADAVLAWTNMLPPAAEDDGLVALQSLSALVDQATARRPSARVYRAASEQLLDDCAGGAVNPDAALPASPPPALVSALNTLQTVLWPPVAH